MSLGEFGVEPGSKSEIHNLMLEVAALREWDVRKFYRALKESGLDGLSHEDGWTIMETATADRLRSGEKGSSLPDV